MGSDETATARPTSDSLGIDPAISVFINCPFDEDYEPIFEALVFTSVCCGFIPRSALESGNVADARLIRIMRAMCSSKYSIHDLCRCGGEGEENLARFNMPLELGMAIARRYISGDEEHDWLVLVPEGRQYIRVVSDLAGFDPKIHNGTVEAVIPKVMSWLLTRPDAAPTPLTPQEVISALPLFRQQMLLKKQEWGNDVPWTIVLLTARNAIPSL